MQVISDIKNGNFDRASVVTVGTFDGVHLGHQKILSVLLEKSKERDLQPIVVTFDPHPQEVVGVKKNHPIKILTPMKKKVSLLEEIGIERIFVLAFDRKLASMSYQDFVQKILIDKLNMKHMVVGHDHALGKNRAGKWEELNILGQETGFTLTRVEPFFLGDERVSSTVIRNSLEQGRVEDTAKMLGRYYALEGKVVAGDGRGRTLHYPTANIEAPVKNIRLPMHGVYAVYVYLNGERFSGMLNIGNRPTFCCKEETVEVHIFDFDADIYEKEIKVEFVERIRAEKKFSGKDELVGQLEKDEKKCREILN